MPAFIKSTTGPRVSRLSSQSIKNDFRKFLQEISCKGKINFLNKIAKKKKPDYPFCKCHPEITVTLIFQQHSDLIFFCQDQDPVLSLQCGQKR